MNILILTSVLFTSHNGIIPKVKSIKDTMIYNMCLGFKELGHNVTLIAAQEYMPCSEEKYDFKILFFKSKYKKIFPPAIFPYLPDLKSYLLDYKDYYDIIISGETFSLQSLTASRICPQKLLIWQELTRHQKKFFTIPSKCWYNIIVPLFMKKTALVVPRSKLAYNFINKYMPRVTQKIVDHGININIFKYSLKKERYIISSSQLILRKNVDSIIRIFSEFHKIEKYKDIKLLIAGRGEEENNLKILVRKLGIQDSVQFLGFLPQKELNRYVRISLCFLINTRRDLNMVSIPESIVSGTPILSNTQPASADYINEYKLGIAKDMWGILELGEIIDNNSFYVRNCIAYRNKLSNTICATFLIEEFKKIKNAKI